MSAVLSDCGAYRYRLDRNVQRDGIVCALIGVNPSTADALVNDATIRKDIGFAKVNGWRKIIKGNVFAYRSTDVRNLANVEDPIGPLNRWHIDQIIGDADLLVPCYGDRGKLPKALRVYLDRMLDYLAASGKPVRIFGRTKGGDPLHPLMLGYDTPLVPFESAAQGRQQSTAVALAQSGSAPAAEQADGRDA